MILTTNNPLDIDKSILEQTLNIPVSSVGKKDISEVLRFYLEDLSQAGCEQIAQKLIQKAGDSAFSNSQITRMCAKAVAMGNGTIVDNMIKLINSTPAEISAKDIKKFNDETEELKRI